MTAKNPRLFDGPVASCIGYERSGSGGTLVCARSGYKRLSVQPGIATGVRQLGVTGVLIACDVLGEAHVCLGRRHAQTRVYGGLWELAPSGGVDPPPPSLDLPGGFTGDDLLRQLRIEAEDELGLPIDLVGASGGVRPLAIVVDPGSPSVDVCLLAELPTPVETLQAMAGQRGSPGSSRWEYDGLLWLSVSDGPRFVAERGAGVIPPTRALLERLPSLLVNIK